MQASIYNTSSTTLILATYKTTYATHSGMPALISPRVDTHMPTLKAGFNHHEAIRLSF